MPAPHGVSDELRVRSRISSCARGCSPSRGGAGHPDRRRSASVPGRARYPARMRAFGVTSRAAREGAGTVRRQHRRRLYRPERTGVPDPQYRARTSELEDLRRSCRRIRQPARSSAAGGGGELRRAHQARRCRLHGRARRDRLGAKAACRRHGESTRARSRRRWPTSAHAAGRHQGRQHPVPAGRLHPGLDRQRQQGARRSGGHGRRRAVPLPAQLAHDARFRSPRSRFRSCRPPSFSS